MTSLGLHGARAFTGADHPARERGWLLDRSFLVGLLDSSVALAYMSGADFSGASSLQMLWYALTLGGKATLLCLTWRRRAALTSIGLGFMTAVAMMIVGTGLGGAHSFTPYVSAFGFLAHLMLTLMLIEAATLKRYLMATTLVITFVAGVHAALCLAHRMPTTWGRASFFGGNQPNLGGEIEAVGVLGAAYSLRRVVALPAMAILTADMIFLQARAAMLVAAGGVVVVCLFEANKRLPLRRLLVLAALGAATFTLLVATGVAGGLADFGSHLLLLNDQYRGLGSGASGRSDLWSWGVELFEESPIYGHGLDYFDQIDFVGPHNLVLFGLAQYGLMSLLFFSVMLWAYIQLFTRDRFRFYVLLAALPLYLFNDRFVNLNPYPFLVYVMLLTPPPPAINQTVSRSFSHPRWRRTQRTSATKAPLAYGPGAGADG